MELAVKRMLPDNRMRKHVWLKRLRVYADDEHPHDSQVNRSASYAPGWLDYGKPLSKKVESDVQIVPFRDDVFGPETPASEWAPGTLSPETDDKDEVAEMFKERWAQEIEFWKKERQGIPEYIYDMHDMPKPEGGEDLTPEEAHAAFLRNLDEFRKTRDADPAWKDFWKGVGDGAEPGSQEENPVFAKYKLHEAEAKEPARKGKKGGRAKPGAGSGVVPVMPKWGKVPVGASAPGAGWKTVYDTRAGAEAGQAGGRQ